MRSFPITVKDRHTGAEWGGTDLAAIIRRAFGDRKVGR